MGRRGEYSAERGIFLRGSVLVLLVRRVVNKNIWMAHAIIKPLFHKTIFIYLSLQNCHGVNNIDDVRGLIHRVFFFRFFEIPFCFPLDFFHSKVLIFFFVCFDWRDKMFSKKENTKKLCCSM